MPIAKKSLAAVSVFALLSVMALGIASASPNVQDGTGSASFGLLTAVLTDADDRGILSDATNDLLSDLLIEYLIAPRTGETVEQVEERLSVEGQSGFQFLTAVLTDADDKGALSDELNELLSDLFIEYLIAPHTGETVEQARIRLSAQPTPTATTTPSTTPFSTATPTIAEMVRNVQGSVVQILTISGSSTGFGTGFIIDSDGHVVTNEHVVEGYQNVTVRMFDGTEHQASVLGVDANADLALIDIDGGENFHSVPLGDSSRVQVGEDVIAIGYPLLVHQLGQPMTVTDGILSTRRPDFAQTGVEYLQHTAVINPGNSGGPLFSRAGQVIGVNAAKQLTNPSGDLVEGVYFAVAINELKSRLEGLKSGGNMPSVTPMPTTSPTPVATPAPTTSPTPVATPSATTDWRWDRWGGLLDSWSISIPSGWSFEPDSSDDDTDFFVADDDPLFVGISVFPNLYAGGIFTLDGFAQLWKSVSESSGAEDYPSTFNVTSFEKQADRGGREFYSLHLEYFDTVTGCWIYGIDHIFTDLDYGAIASGRICDSDGIATDDDWGDMPEILDSFELHHYTFVDIYRNNLHGHSLDLGLHYYLSEDSEEHDFSFFWGFEGSTRVAFLNVWTFEASAGIFYELEDFAKWRRERAIAYASEQGRSQQVKSFTKHSETSPVDGVTRQWYEFKYREDDDRSCVSDVTELIILEDSMSTGGIGYVVTGSVCESHLSIWGPRRDEALDSFRP